MYYQKEINEEIILGFLPNKEIERKIMLRRFKGMSLKSISEDIGVSEVTVIKYHKLAKIKIACCLAYL